MLSLLLLAGCAIGELPPPTGALPTPASSAPSPAVPTDRPTDQPTDAPTGALSPPVATASPTAEASPVQPAEPPPIAFELVASGFTGLVLLTHAGDGSGQVYVVEQRGVIWATGTDGSRQSRPFLDISDRISAGGERGLLGLAFHPDFASTGRYFINYTDAAGSTVVSEILAPAGPDDSEQPPPERVLLRIDQPFANHNGGMLAFGHDGMLYVSTGDGGSAGDPLGAGQDRASLLGKILRLNVDAGVEPYAIPADNPFASAADGTRPEIWALGVRNPWRMSFDRQTGALFFGDVGQDRWEEVNAEPAGVGGRNYGWSVMEGPECHDRSECDTSGLTMPAAWYPTSSGCAISGGYVYRGSDVDGLAGFYLFADYCTGSVSALSAADALAGAQVPVTLHEMGNTGISVTSFGEDEAGEMYLVGAGGEMLRVVGAGD
ncbi:PQQ-dependent sugar dehydrogenase [soil metagenome]